MMQKPDLAKQLAQLLRSNAKRIQQLVDPKRVLAGQPDLPDSVKLTMIVDTIGIQALALSLVLDEMVALLEPEPFSGDGQQKGPTRQ